MLPLCGEGIVRGVICMNNLCLGSPLRHVDRDKSCTSCMRLHNDSLLGLKVKMKT